MRLQASILVCVACLAAPVTSSAQLPPPATPPQAASAQPAPTQPSAASGPAAATTPPAAAAAAPEAAAAAAPAAAAPPQLSKAPKLVRFVQAEAPAALATRGSADVVLLIDVDEHGAVQAVSVSEPAGDGFDEAAVAAAKRFEFEPGEYHGKPVPVRITYRYHFFYEAPPPPAATPAAPTPAPAAPVVSSVPVDGVVLRKGDRSPLEGASLVLDDGAQTALTDAHGHFDFAAVPVGKHILHLRGPGVTPMDSPITLNAGRRLTLTYRAEAVERYASTVRGKREEPQAVEQTLQGEELRRIPGTQGDTLKAVQNLPGVARAPLGGGQLVVWGSSPQDTRVYVDGVYVPSLYHFGGLRSTFNGEMVQSLSFSPGGYGASYGRGMGGLVEVESRLPRTDAPHGFVQMDLMDGSLMLDTPLSKNLSLSVGARRSWVDVFIPLFSTSDFQLSPVYFDYQSKLHWRASPRDDVDFLVFGSDDKLHLQVRRSDPADALNADVHNYYHRALTHWRHRFDGGATADLTASIGYDAPFQIAVTIGNTQRVVDFETFAYALRGETHVPLSDVLRLDAGLDFEGNRWPVQLTFPASGAPREGDAQGTGAGRTGGIASDDYTFYSNSAAPFAGATLSLLQKKLVIVPQLRFDLMSFSGYTGTPQTFTHSYGELEPRAHARYQVLPWLAPKLAIGLYHQPPNVYEFSRAFGNPTLEPEAAIHYVAGVDVDPTSTLHVELEGFYKDLSNLVVRGSRVGGPILENAGIGRVYGAQLLVRQELTHNFFGWVTYTLSRSERRDHPESSWRIFQYDQTHILTLIGSYKFPHGYQLGLRFRYVTGNPYTPLVGAYYDSNQDRYRSIPGPVYSARLGSFNELDIRFDKTWTFDLWKLSMYLDIINVYNAHNPEGIAYNFDYSRSQPQSGLPFLPVLGIRGEL